MNILERFRPSTLFSGGSTWILPIAAIVPGFYLLRHGQINSLVALLFFLPLLVLAIIDARSAIYITLFYLFVLGDVRRIAGLVAGYPAQDQLLLVGPIITIILVMPILYRLRLLDAVSKVVFAIMILMFLEVFNPRQGGIKIGLTGAFFQLIPLLWFWIGQRYGTDRVMFVSLFRIVLPLAVVAACIGLYQTFVGFPFWQAAWVANASQTYHSLFVGGFIRAFGFSVNGIEYVNLLLISSAACVAIFFARRRTYICAFPLLGTALFLASARQPILKLIASVTLAWSLRGGAQWKKRLSMAVAFAVVLLTVASLHGGGNDSAGGGAKANSAAAAEAQHQIQGLTHPTQSTASGHIRYFLAGIAQGFKYPIGSGLGIIRGGAGQSGNSQDDTSDLNTTEYDISDAFITMGAVGGLLYVAAVFLVLRRGIEFGRRAPAYIALPMVSVIVSMIGSWDALGQYGMAPYLWFFIGALTRLRPEELAARLPEVPQTHHSFAPPLPNSA